MSTLVEKEKEELEFQLFRMQQNMERLKDKNEIKGIAQDKEDNWVIVYTNENQHQCNVMIQDCQTPYRGAWDFLIQATFTESGHMKIGDIKGPSNKGYGSIAMDELKQIAVERNVKGIKGDLAERDWDHIDRLIHFYEKHSFDIDVNEHKKEGDIYWSPSHY